MSSAPKLHLAQAWHLEIDASTSRVVDSNCIGLGVAVEPNRLVDLTLQQNFNHICQRQGHQFNDELMASEHLVAAPKNYFDYPIASILSPGSVSSDSEKQLTRFEYLFDNSNQKRAAMDQITDALSAQAQPQSLIADAVLVADELFTNAVYNAPFVDKITQINPGISRSSLEVKMGDGKQGKLILGMDQSRLVICCQDPYGSLSIQRYLTKVKNTYEKGAAATMNFGPGGAGLGSYIIFNAGSSIYIGVNPGQATLICCVIPLKMSNRKRAQLPKHLHWIQL